MNSKRSDMWLILGCINMIKAAFMALQNKLENIAKEVLMTTDRMRTVLRGLFGTEYGRKTLAKDMPRISIIVLCLLTIIEPAHAAPVTAGEIATDFIAVIKPLVTPFVIIMMIITAVGVGIAIGYHLVLLALTKDQTAMGNITTAFTYGILAEAFWSVFWLVVQFIISVSGENIQF